MHSIVARAKCNVGSPSSRATFLLLVQYRNRASLALHVTFPIALGLPVREQAILVNAGGNGKATTIKRYSGIG